MDTGTDTMKSLLMEFLPEDRRLRTGIEGLSLVRRDHPYEPVPYVYKPQIILLAQGRKNVYLGDRVYTYDRDNYLVLTVPLPVKCESILDEGEPLLGMVLEIDPRIIGEILSEMGEIPSAESRIDYSIYQDRLTGELQESVVRLLRTLRSERETRVLGPVYLKEILFKILNGEHGEVLKDLAYNNRNLYQISRVIKMIHEDISRPLEVQSLAREAGMSTSSFHTSFRTFTSSSPLQYIKSIRLHRAKELIQQEGEKAYAAALRVGYESTSQFNREYKRLFGVTPAKDKAGNPAV